MNVNQSLNYGLFMEDVNEECSCVINVNRLIVGGCSYRGKLGKDDVAVSFKKRLSSRDTTKRRAPRTSRMS